MNERVNDSKRFDSVIEKYNNIFTTLTHTELADEILEGEEKMKRPLDISHRTLRRYVGDFRDRLEKAPSKKITVEDVQNDRAKLSDLLKQKPLTPSESFKPSGITADDMYNGYNSTTDPLQLSFDFDPKENPLMGVPVWEVPKENISVTYGQASSTYVAKCACGMRLGVCDGRCLLKKPLDAKPPEPGINAELLKKFSEKFGKTEKTWVIGGCMHLPFHNKKMMIAFTKFLSYMKSIGQLDGLLLAGDIVDNHNISRHAKGKITLPGYDLSREYQEANQVLDIFDNVVGKDVEKVFFYGNHEDWYYEYMSNVDNTKLGGDVIKSPKEALKLKERGYTVFDKYKKARFMVGDILVIHGEWVNKHAAHEHIQRMKKNVMFVHTHRMGSYVEGEFVGYNIGWMGDKDQPVFGYMSDIQKDSWANGFAVVTVDEDGYSHVTQLMWKNNAFYYGGKRFE